MNPRISLLRVSIVFLVLVTSLSLKSSAQTSGDDVILRAMQDELQRSVKELQFKDLEKPYFIQYTILDREEYDAEATFGYAAIYRA